MVGATLFRNNIPGHIEQCPRGAFKHPGVLSRAVNPDIRVKRTEREEDGAFQGAEEEKADNRTEHDSGIPNSSKAEISPSMTIPGKAPPWRDQMDARGTWLTRVLACLLNPSGYWG
ncbi:hypothetical protein NDU88_001965 [Pleurodeles waltl]|uniref:Uncharacterized protein n=1 Tax=Pleurodeles waltl TaxID=8319 RepID=A0AAV7M118_PLEWA|nr:hypothetical protein NDU88_001965 [Pleurodeles waltl]